MVIYTVFSLNFSGTLLPTRVFVKQMVDRGGNIINISSMNAFTPLTKILAAALMDRFGESEELDGALLFLGNDQAAGFITGVVLSVDGGFSAYSGV